MTTTNNKSRKMVARFDGRCPHCQGAITAGETVAFRPDRGPGHKVAHLDCARADVLPSRIFACGIKSLTDSFDEMYWRAQEAKLSAELETVKASIAARLSQAQEAA